MQGLLGLNIKLTGGHYILAVLKATEAEAIWDGYRLGTLKEVIGGRTVAVPGLADSICWSVRVKDVVGLHTMPVEAISAVQAPAADNGSQHLLPPFKTGYGSGLSGY